MRTAGFTSTTFIPTTHHTPSCTPRAQPRCAPGGSLLTGSGACPLPRDLTDAVLHAAHRAHGAAHPDVARAVCPLAAGQYGATVVEVGSEAQKSAAMTRSRGCVAARRLPEAARAADGAAQRGASSAREARKAALAKPTVARRRFKATRTSQCSARGTPRLRPGSQRVAGRPFRGRAPARARITQAAREMRLYAYLGLLNFGLDPPGAGPPPGEQQPGVQQPASAHRAPPCCQAMHRHKVYMPAAAEGLGQGSLWRSKGGWDAFAASERQEGHLLHRRGKRAFHCCAGLPTLVSQSAQQAPGPTSPPTLPQLCRHRARAGRAKGPPAAAGAAAGLTTRQA
jgi:hypothetical protein